MIHPMTLPTAAERALGRAIRVQIRLFEFAAQEVLNQTDLLQRNRCGVFLDGCTDLIGNGQTIAKWFWDQRALFTRLANFSKGDPADKQRWATDAATDVDVLSALGAGQAPAAQAVELHPIERLPHVTKKAPATWRHHGVDYLIGWYSLFRSRTLPEEVTGGSQFGGQNFLKEYDRINGRNHVCPACDEESWLTRVLRKRKKRSARQIAYIADVDHFFPKSFYPHFAIHPHNLVPICKVCNSTIKLDEDPLIDSTGKKRPIQHVPAPYWTQPLREEMYLQFGATPQEPLVLVRFSQSLVPAERLEVLTGLYAVPDRWSTHYERDDEYYFEQVKQLVTYRRELCSNPLTAAELKSDLERFLRILRGRYGRHPRQFALYWWVMREIELLDQVRPNNTTAGTKLLDEVNALLRVGRAPVNAPGYPVPKLTAATS